MRRSRRGSRVSLSRATRSSGMRSRGQTIVEYLLVVVLFVLAIAAGPHSPLEALFAAVGDRYQRFTETISMP